MVTMVYERDLLFLPNFFPLRKRLFFFNCIPNSAPMAHKFAT